MAIGIYATLGPGCSKPEILEDMLRSGLTGVRWNSAFVPIEEAEDFLAPLRAAERAAGRPTELLLELQGRTLRVGSIPDSRLRPREEIFLGPGGMPVPEEIFPLLRVEDTILLNDGRITLRVTKTEAHRAESRVVRGAELKEYQNLILSGAMPTLPPFTESDRRALSRLDELGVNAVMLPFTHSREDAEAVRGLLLPSVRLLARIEDQSGLNALEEIIPACDGIVICRGTLGATLGLWELPRVQEEIASLCRERTCPFLVEGQLLATPVSRSAPTCGEIMDGFYTARSGTAGLLLTGETAEGEMAAAAVKIMGRIVRSVV